MFSEIQWEYFGTIFKEELSKKWFKSLLPNLDSNIFKYICLALASCFQNMPRLTKNQWKYPLYICDSASIPMFWNLLECVLNITIKRNVSGPYFFPQTLIISSIRFTNRKIWQSQCHFVTIVRILICLLK